MTTIAVRDGKMACDSRITGGFIAATKTKIITGRNCLVGFCGDYIACYSGALWLAGELSDRPSTSDSDDVLFLVLRGKDIYLADAQLREAPVGGKYWAIGSGEQAAMTAMHMGATAKEAVKMAKLVDECTGGRVREFSLENSTD